MIDAIRTYIANCPLLDEYTAVNVEYLVDKVTAYSINENVGYNPVINEYVTGEKEMQYQFNFDAKFYWNEETQNNIDNAKFFEDFKDWLEQKNDNNEFPEIEGIEPISISATTNGYIFATNADVAIYRISCVFNYIKPPREVIPSA